MNLKQFFKRFQTKVTLAMVAALLFTVALSNIFIYQFTYHFQFNNLREKLMMTAQAAALTVDPRILQSVPLDQSGVNTPQFKIIAERLKQIKRINPQVKFIYTLTKTDKPGVWKFIVDPEPVTMKGMKGVKTALPGDLYNAGRFPEMLRAFESPAADKRIESDEWGRTLSGYAPIRDADGKPFAVLGVDIMADDVYLMEKEIQKRSMIILVLGMVFVCLLGMLISKRITDPVEELVEGTQRIAKGDLKFQVPLKGDDEIAQLAHSFNEMARSLEQSRKRLLEYFYDVVKSLVKTLEARDHYTKGHSEAVSEYAVKIAEKMSLPAESLELFRKMVLLHDIGKIGVSDSILNKKESLTAEEWDVIKKHPQIGEEIIKPVLSDKEMLKVIRHHHERFDGKGYPDQLKEDEISLFAAIVSVADAYDAMTTERSYRSALSHQEAIEELKRNRATQFHPKVVDTFLEILKEESSLS